jgi:hypothetical protein
MSVNLSPVGNAFQFFNNEGLPLNGGKLFTYQAGSTTPFPTYTDVNGLIANTNPIILGTDGRPPSTIWLTNGFFYKFILTDANDVTIQTYDNLYGIIGTAPSPPTPIPSGVILLWSGSIGSIPTGYVLCNGSNGTPDLRDRFIVGAGSTYAVNASGGSADAIVVSHTHTATSTSVVTDPGHVHNTSLHNGTTNFGNNYSGAPFTASGAANTGSATTGITVATTTTNASAGTSGTNANLPPYYALAYIMKT